MSSITIRKVETKKDLKKFIEFHYDLYKGNKYDVPSLFFDEKNTFDEKKNPAFEFCDVECFLAYKDNKIVGRVAGIINHKANEKWKRKSVRFGWIDFVDDIEVSRALLKAVEDFGRARGMEEIVGPLGFTDMDPEGMLIEGFDKMSTIITIYNYPYYPRHIEQLGGFEKDNDYVEYLLTAPKEMPKKYMHVTEMFQQRYNLKVIHPTRRDVTKGKIGHKIFEIINETYKDLYGYSQLSERQIDYVVNTFFPVIDLNFVAVVVDQNENDKIVGVAIAIPSLSKALQKCRRGRLFPFGWWHLLRVIKFHQTDGVDLVLLGVLPEYRVKGANALIFADFIPRSIKYGYKWAESQPEMETNKLMQNQWGPFEKVNHKRRRCYKKKLE